LQPPVVIDWEAKDVEQVVVSNNDFGFDLLRTVTTSSSTEKNLVFSPLSISIALSMALAGARNKVTIQIVWLCVA